jgi:hypothetical protein
MAKNIVITGASSGDGSAIPPNSLAADTHRRLLALHAGRRLQPNMSAARSAIA